MSRFCPSPAPLTLAVALAMGTLAAAVQAQPVGLAPVAAPVEISIAAQPLGQALNALARQTGLELIVQPTLVDGKTAPAVAGLLTPRQALDKLLAGSGLMATIDGSVVTVRRVPAAAVDGVTLPSVTVSAQAERSATTEQTGSFTARALTIGKMEQSIRETPQSVTVVTRQQMDDQKLTAIEDVIAQTTGTAKSQRNFGAHVYTLRGYVIPDTNFLLDGVAGGAYNPTGWVPMDTAIFDRVEVLRGAGALVVGAGDPSGVVNMVRKRPRAEKHFDFAQSVGSWSNYRTEIDGGGPINEAGTVRGRVVAAYTDRKYFYDLAHSKEPLLYGVVEADLGRDTKGTIGYRHQSQNMDGYTIFQLPLYTTGASLNVPRSTSLGQHWNHHEARINDVFAEVEHHFEGDWRGKLTVNHSETSVLQKLNTARGAVNPATGKGTAITSNYFVDRAIDANGLDAHLSGSFEAWGRSHRAMLGTSWTQQKSLHQTTTMSMNIPVDIFNFNHSLIPEPVTPAYGNVLRDELSLFGIYGSTRLELASGLNLHLGGRFNWYSNRTDNVLTGKVTNDYKQDAQFTPYAGLVYDLDPHWSVYASYTNTFVPQSQYATAGGRPLDPAIGSNYEAGLKGEFFDGKLNAAFAVFNIKKRNVAVLDTVNIGGCPGIATNDCYRSASRLRSKGFDAELAGRVAPGWEVAGGYTYLTTRDDSGTPLTSDAPRNILRASTSYTLPGEWSAWTVGANLSAQSGSFVGNIHNPGRAILDLRAAYRINPIWTASLNVGNVTDKTYWQIIGSTRNGNAYGTPRNVMATLRGSF